MKYFNLHTHKFTNSYDFFELVNQYPWEFDATIPNYSIGIHPWYIDAVSYTHLDVYKRQAFASFDSAGFFFSFTNSQKIEIAKIHVAPSAHKSPL